jgi:hypothetical protein
VAKKSELGRRTLTALFKAARAGKAEQRANEQCARQIAERLDPRPRIMVPAVDLDWLPQVEVVNDVLGTSKAPKPPVRDVDGTATRSRKLALPSLHAFDQTQSNPKTENKT